jgi:hypothetical protein
MSASLIVMRVSQIENLAGPSKIIQMKIDIHPHILNQSPFRFSGDAV